MYSLFNIIYDFAKKTIDGQMPNTPETEEMVFSIFYGILIINALPKKLPRPRKGAGPRKRPGIRRESGPSARLTSRSFRSYAPRPRRR